VNLVTRIASSLGFVQKAAVPRAFQSLEGERGGWTSMFPRSPFDFDRDIRWSRDGVMANWAVYACMTLIASDIAKVQLKLVEKDGAIWKDAESPSFSPVLRKPNRYQTRQQFIETWVLSKLAHGNTYVLKERNGSGIVSRLHVLDPCRVKPLVTESGLVYYELSGDDLAGVPDERTVRVPASEIIHDRMSPLFHPLIGISPLYACGLAAAQGLEIQSNSWRFFRNGSRPSVVLSAPGQISDATAQRLKEAWETGFTGANAGRVAVLGDDLKPVSLAVNPDVAQLVEQLKLTAEMICAAFAVPGFKIGVGAAPTYQNVSVLDQVYYSNCLQKMTEAIEALLDEGLGLDEKKEGKQLGTMFDLDDLLKMDPQGLTASLDTKVKGTIMSPDEARARLNLPPTPGGAEPLAQQQIWPLSVLAKRDPPKEGGMTPAGPAVPPPADPPPDAEAKALIAITKALSARLDAEVACG
jgi:HK97 family phage portal protein